MLAGIRSAFVPKSDDNMGLEIARLGRFGGRDDAGARCHRQLVLGAAMLVDTDVPEYRVSWWVIGTMAAMSIAVLVLLLGFTLRAYRRPAVSGARTLVGASAHVLEWSGGQGFVWAAGERWRATGATELRSGDSVRVCAVDGIALVVSREPGESPAAGTAP
jgi:membrane-bound serine protease (ClpP class)